MGDTHRAPRARGERRRHTITNGVDCDLVSEGSGGSSILRGLDLAPTLGLLDHPFAWEVAAKAGFGGGLECQLITNISPHAGLNPLEGWLKAR